MKNVRISLVAGLGVALGLAGVAEAQDESLEEGGEEMGGEEMGGEETGGEEAGGEETGDAATVVEEGAAEGGGAIVGYPIAWSARPLTLRKGMLEIDGDVGIHLVTGADASIGLAVTAAYGVMDQLEVGALVAPLAISPEFDYGDPAVWARYGILQGDTELGAELSVGIPVSGGDLRLGVGVPVRLHMDALRIDTGLAVDLSFSDPLGKSLAIPVQVYYDVMETLAVGLRTGLVMPDFDPSLGGLPLGLAAIYTIGEGKPTADIEASLSFPFFLSFADGAENPGTDWISIGLKGSFFLDT